MRNFIEGVVSLALAAIFFWWIFAYPIFPIFEDEPTHMVEWSLTMCAGLTTYILFYIQSNSSKNGSLGPDLGFLVSVLVVIVSVLATSYSMRMQVYRELPCTKVETFVCNVCTQSDYDQGGNETCLSWDQEECERCTEKTYYVK